MVVQRSWRRALFISARTSASTKIQTKYRSMVSLRAYLTCRAAAIRSQSQWRLFAARNKYLRLHRNIVLAQSVARRWQYGVVCVQRRKAALQILQNRARRWLAIRVVDSMRVHRVEQIQKAIICQVRVVISLVSFYSPASAPDVLHLTQRVCSLSFEEGFVWKTGCARGVRRS